MEAHQSSAQPGKHCLRLAGGVCAHNHLQLRSKVYTPFRICRRIMQNACNFLFSTDLNKVFIIKYVYI